MNNPETDREISRRLEFLERRFSKITSGKFRANVAAILRLINEFVKR